MRVARRRPKCVSMFVDATPELRMQLRRVRCHDYRIVGIHIRAADIVGIQLVHA